LSVSAYREKSAHLVPDESLLDGGEVLEGAEDSPCKLLATDILGKVAKLLGENKEHLVLVIKLVLWGLAGKKGKRMIDGRAVAARE
jgi:hypothetical protein